MEVAAGQVLKFAPFERYMLADDAKYYPMTCHMRFWFDGVADRPAFESAARIALARHPLLCALARKRRRLIKSTWYFEVFAPDVAAILDWGSEADPVRFERLDAPDMRTRLIVRAGGGKTTLFVKFHHSVCDGIGTLRFVEDLMMAYHEQLTGKTTPLLPIDLARLADRETIGLTKREWAAHLRLDLERITKFFRALATPLAAKVKAPPNQAADLGSAARTVLGKDATANLLTAAKTRGVTLNDLLLSRLFRVAARWNRRVGQSPARCVVRLSVPISLRTEKQANMPAANLVSMVFLDRRVAHIFDETALLCGVAQEMQRIKDCNMGLALIRCINWISRMGGCFCIFLRSPMCMATVVLTNLGRPFMGSQLVDSEGYLCTGNLRMTDLDTMPPIRHKTRASISVSTYAGRFGATIRYDSRVWTSADADTFLADYLAELQQAIAPVGLDANLSRHATRIH